MEKKNLKDIDAARVITHNEPLKGDVFFKGVTDPKFGKMVSKATWIPYPRVIPDESS